MSAQGRVDTPVAPILNGYKAVQQGDCIQIEGGVGHKIRAFRSG